MRNHRKVFIICGILLLLGIQIACVISAQENISIPISTTPLKTEVKTSTNEAQVFGYNHIRDLDFTENIYLDIIWSPNDHRFVVVTINDVILYNADTLETIWRRLPQSQGSTVSGAAFTSDGKTLILFDKIYGLQVINAKNGDLVSETRNLNNPADCQQLDSAQTILTPDDKTLIISTENPEHGYTPQIQLWDITTLGCKEVLAETEGHNRSLDLSPDGRYLANGLALDTGTLNNEIIETGRITVWDMQIKKPICEINDHGAYARFLPGGSLLAVPDPEKNEIAYWDVTNCAVDKSLSGVSSKYGFAFNPNGQSIALWNGEILIIDSEKGDILQVIDDRANDVVFAIDRIYNEFLFSHDGQYLIYSFIEGANNYKFSLWKYDK